MPDLPRPELVPNADLELAEDCRLGLIAAYERLYQTHGERMKSLALNLLGNIQDAEDAVQEAFLKVYRSVSSFKGEAAFTTWIYRILVNSCYDLMRKRQRRSPEIPQDEGILRSGNLPLPDCPDHSLRLTLEKSLGQLNPRSRAVFLLFEVEGFKHREIAEIMNMPEGTSKNLLFEAKKELQRMLFGTTQSSRS